MSRCKSCDTIMNDYDLRRRDKASGEFIDLCGYCYGESEQARFAAEEANFIGAEVVPGLEEET